MGRKSTAGPPGYATCWAFHLDILDEVNLGGSNEEGKIYMTATEKTDHLAQVSDIAIMVP